MADYTASALDRVPFKITDPQLIPAERYYDEEFFRLENERLWPHVWQMACRLEEIPEVGDFVEYSILDKSVIVVNTKNGVKAFHNACRHRGVRLVTEPGNCAKTGFICPFHGWRWNAEGRNTFVFGKQIFAEDLLDHAEIDLPPVRVEFWAGCAFINFDDNAPPLLDCLGPVAETLNARNVDKLKMDWWYATVLPTNWKLAMEAFMEGYHVMRTHPQLHDLMPGNSYGRDVDEADPRHRDSRQMVNLMVDFYARLSTGMAGMVHETEVAVLERLRDMEVPEDPMAAVGAFIARAQEEVSRDGLARGAPMFDIPSVNREKPFHDVEFMFPHFFLLPSFAAMSSYRIRPLTAETCLFEIWSLVLRPEGEPYDTPKAPTILPYDSEEFPEIPRQDYSNLPRQQLGLHAGKFRHMRLSREQEGMISNYQRLVDGYLEGRDPETLRKAQTIVNSGYNAPILDIGFEGRSPSRTQRHPYTLPRSSTMTEEPHLLVDVVDDIIVATFNRPDKLNAMSFELMERLEEAVHRFRDTPELRVMLIKAKGRYFSAGADLKQGGGATQREFPTKGSQVREQHRRGENRMRRLWDEMEAIEKPFVVAHHARCVGGSLEMSLSCDFRLAAAGASYAFPEAKFGVLPATNGVSRLVRVVGPHWARLLVMANLPIDAQEARIAGLVHKVFPDETFEEDVMAFCRHVAKQNAEMVGTAKVAIELAADLGAHQAASVERLANSALMLSPDYRKLMVSHVASIGKGKGL